MSAPRIRGWAARLAAPALCLAVGACATAPEAPLPPAPLPAAYPDSRADGGADAPALPAWRDFFLDAELRRILAVALDNSRDLRAAELRVREAAAAYDVQRSGRYPFVAASLAGTRAQVAPAQSPTGRSMLGNQFQAGIGFADWELDLWGRLRSLNRAALDGWLAADAARRFAGTSLVAQVADAYLGLRELDERLALARRTLASRDESLRIFRRRHALGAASRLNLTQVELLRQQALAQVAQLEQARAQQAALLDLLAGTPVTLAPAAGPLGDLRLARELAPGLPSALLQERADVVAAEHALRAARANVQAARAAFFPRIALTASAGAASTALDSLFERDSRAWTVAPALALPVFNGGRLAGQLGVSEARREQALVQYERAIQGAFRDVADALAARRWLSGQAQALQATVLLQGERARVAKLRYDSGAAAYLEVLDAERERFGAEQQLVQLQRQQLSAQVALYRALGGGARRLPELAPAHDE
ncbi:efflux transporter outer membrane subunit [uncultured Massilia sp.]|uniref:efflux transporter outer membrane subunit n=1 Tax=uncultured Massilia sp. TaxID=169973 RepID=UPI0025E627BB|nr:efflux transporter outer membrane subunit [uncultured Massilia sp.]